MVGLAGFSRSVDGTGQMFPVTPDFGLAGRRTLRDEDTNPGGPRLPFQGELGLRASYHSTRCSRKSSNELRLLPEWLEKLHIVILFKNINWLLNLQKDRQRGWRTEKLRLPVPEAFRSEFNGLEMHLFSIKFF